MKIGVLVFTGKYFDILSKILICFSSLALGQRPRESKSPVLIFDLAPLRDVFLNSRTLTFIHLKCM